MLSSVHKILDTDNPYRTALQILPTFYHSDLAHQAAAKLPLFYIPGRPHLKLVATRDRLRQTRRRTGQAEGRRYPAPCRWRRRGDLGSGTQT